jgi:hypothetical protein
VQAVPDLDPPLVGGVVLVLSALLLLVFGSEVSTAAAGAFLEQACDAPRWPVLAACVVLAFAPVYYFAPDVEQRFKWVSPGRSSRLPSGSCSRYSSRFSSTASAPWPESRSSPPSAKGPNTSLTFRPLQLGSRRGLL